MMHYVCRLAEKRGIPMQIHTGLHASGRNYIDNSNPVHLNNLFIEYPELKFDIFHIGYPYHQTLSALAQTCSNVYIDMCWAHMFSPVASIENLSELLEAIPYNKILAFGGDLGGGEVHSVYAHAKIARRNVAKVLVHKIEDGLFDEDKAIQIAKMLFHDNAVELFNLRDI